MEFFPKEVQKSLKERVRRQGKSTVNVGGKGNVLTLPRLRLSLVPRKPRQFVGDQSSLDQVVDVILKNRRADPVAWIEPCGRPALEEDPPRLVAFPFDFAVAFFARSRAVVLSFTIVADETRVVRWRWGESERSGGA